MKTTISLFLLLLSLNQVFSQSEKQDVIYLKNGSVIRGEIISNSSGNGIKIETEGNNIWVFKQTDVDSVRKEEKKIPKKEFHFREKGFYNITDAGILAGKNSYQNLFSPGVITINGYRFLSGISLGIGIGAEAMEIISAPLFGEIRYDIFKKNSISPFFAFQAGYSFPLQNSVGYYDNHYKGGIMINPEIGLRNYFSNGTAIVFSIGYRYQQLHSTRPVYWRWEERIGQTETITHFNRVALRVGFLFN